MKDLKVDLKEELTQSRDDSYSEHNDIIDVSKQLLSSNEQSEIQIIRNLHVDKRLQKSENEMGKTLERKTAEEEFGPLFTANEVKRLCLKYRLKFLEVKYYQGVIDTVLASKLKEFSDKHGLGLDGAHVDRDTFYIMAPPNHFIPNIELKNYTPLMFYRIHKGRREKDYFRLIHNWGDNFSSSRSIRGWIFSNWLNFSIATSIAMSLLLHIIFPHMSWVFAMLFGVFFGLISIWGTTFENGVMELDFTVKHWKTTFRIPGVRRNDKY